MFSALFARISLRSFLFTRPFFDQGFGPHTAIRQRYGRVCGAAFLSVSISEVILGGAVGVTSGKLPLFAGMSIWCVGGD